MVLSPESLTFRELGERCHSVAADNLDTSVVECDKLICDIDRATDWGFITDGQAIDLLQIVYRCRHSLMRAGEATPTSVHPSSRSQAHQS